MKTPVIYNVHWVEQFCDTDPLIMLLSSVSVRFLGVFHGSGFAGSDPDFYSEPDPNPDSGKKVQSVSGYGQKDPDPKHWFWG